MSPRGRDTDEVLVAHAASLRVLARHLVADEHGAEDALQDTWLRALERPPAHGERLGGWLATVLRRQVSNRRRGEARRVRREREVARPEAADEHDDRARSLRAVVEAVLALDEPYRHTVLSRYFEDLPPRAIARSEGVSVDTVQSRLTRARARLRERLARELEDETGGGARGLLLLAGLAPDRTGAATAAALTTGALLVGTKAKSILFALCALILAFLGWRVWPDEALPAVAAAPAPGAPPLREVGPEREVLAAPSRDAQAAPPAAPIPEPARAPIAAPDQPYHVVFRVRAEEDGRGLAGALVSLAPSAHMLQVVTHTGLQGDAEVSWLGLEERMTVVVAARWAHRWSGPWRLELRAGRAHQVELQVQDELGSGAWDGLWQIDRDAPEAGAALALSSLVASEQLLASDAYRNPPDPTLVFAEPFWESRNTRSNLAQLASSPATWKGRDRRGLEDLFGDHWFQTHELGLEARARRVRAGYEEDPPPPARATPAGAGRPHVTLWGRSRPGLRFALIEDERRLARASATRSDVEGRFEFPESDIGPGRLLVRDPHLGQTLPLEVDRGARPGARPWPVDLPQEPRLGGIDVKVASAAGLPPVSVEARVWTRWPGGLQRGAWMWAGEEPGTYVLTGLPPGEYDLEVGDPVHGWKRRERVKVKSGRTTRVKELTLDEPASLEIEVPEDAPRPRWLVRRRDDVWTRIAELRPRRRAGFALPPGAYLLIDPRAPEEALPIPLASGERWEVAEGELRTPAPGRRRSR